MEKLYTTKNYKQTQKLGKVLAREILKIGLQKQAVVLGLRGNLGGGKTTFLQGFAEGLGVGEKILSPTFVILKKFKISRNNFKNFYHIDCYRLNDSKDILELDFKTIISDPKNIIAIEWPEKVRDILPEGVVNIYFEFVDKTKRKIEIKM